MQKKRLLPSLLTGLALFGAVQGVWAIGWARAQQSAVLGHPLDFSATLRLDPGDSVAAECVTSEVSIGDRRLPAPSVRVQVDASNPEALVMHVRSAVTVDEPVVVVTLAIGCPARMSRRFVLLADPPALTPPAVAAVAPATPVPAEATAPLLAQAAPANVEPAPATQQPPRRAEPSKAAPRPPAPKKPRNPPKPPAPAAKPATPPAAAAPLARLRLDAVEPPSRAEAAGPAASAVADALEAVAQAASAARAAASAASQAEDRVATLERSVNQLRAESTVNRDLVAQMRSRLNDAEGASRWLVPLLVALLALAGLAGWLLWRLRQMQNERQAIWRRAAAEAEAARPHAPTSQLPLVTSEIMAPVTVPQGAQLAPPLPTSAPLPMASAFVPETATERTQVLPPQAAVDDGSPRDVSIEELLDLEQQAEFFIVLGQEDAAVDLLVDHLRNTGGGSPLPYLKLLEIYRRRGARDAYERTRTRFNHRFNAYAPDWDSDLQQGRTLENYAGVLPRLQQVWPRPLDAMAELEALLFRKSRGDLFELPAYREVLFLYSLARDLLDREAADSGNVDLLLPLADGGEFSSTSPHPYFGMERDSVFDSLGGGDRPTAPIDLDLTQPEAPSVIDAPPPRRR